MNPVLSVRKLRKVYPGRPPFTAVDEISFDVKKGEILGLLGPNGAGKTTTIQMLIGTLTYSSGSIRYFDLDFNQHRKEILGRVAFASTYVSLPWLLTISQNLNVYGHLYGLSTQEIRRRSRPLLEQFGILDLSDRRVSSLSAGQVTRLMLVKAFLVEPDIVMLDEPTASLDPDVAQDVCRFLRDERKKRGISILFTSHKMAEVAEVCDRVIFLEKGKIVADDRPQNLARSAARHRLHLQVGEGLKRTVAIAAEKKFEHQTENGSITVVLDESQIAEFLTALARADIIYSSIRIQEPSLEEYFLKMAKKS